MADKKERWIVDAMNVIGSRPDGWWNDPKRAMRDFAAAIDEYAHATGKAITVVFDHDPGALPHIAHIEIVVAHRAGRNAADFQIERIVNTHEDPTSLRIVTSDRRLIEAVTAQGAAVLSSSKFRDEFGRRPTA